MGIFSFGRRRSREQAQPKLPLYNPVTPRRGASEKRAVESDDSDDSDDYDSDDYSDASSSPTIRHSRQTSSELSATAHMLPKRTFEAAPRPPRRFFYRVPSRIVRYLCLAMITTILILIASLARASIVENRRISAGKLPDRPPPPAPWESFDFLTRYYGGLRTYVPFDDNVPQYPRLEDEVALDAFLANETKQVAAPFDPEKDKVQFPGSKAFPEHPQSQLPDSQGGTKECFIDKQGKVRVPAIQYLPGRTSGFPESIIGSYETINLAKDVCFERFGRYGPYGYGYSVRSGGLGLGEHGDKESSDSVWAKTPRVNFAKMDWAEAQRRCYQANAGSYNDIAPAPGAPRGFYIHHEKSHVLQRRDEALETKSSAAPSTEAASAVPTPSAHANLPRTAVVVRCWDEFAWREEDILNLRALIAELSLASGGRYDVHLLVQLKNEARWPIWADEEMYKQRIQDSIPEEFRGIATLWSETQMLSLYQGVFDMWSRGPDLPVHGVYRGLQMAMQFFAYNHPEYDYFWQWEMDIRYTSHYHDLFSKLESWARDQPRKGLWERNARFYIPSVHGSWEDFKQMVRVQTEMGTVTADNVWDNVPGVDKPKKETTVKGEKSVWGPVRPEDPEDWFDTDDDPEPPTTYERDRYEWGVGEEADLITLNPIFDPDGTTWLLEDDITGYNRTAGKIPRRAQIITASRMSRKLLIKMHRETAFKKHFAFSEMWPATAALQHGYKAVYVPHPVYVDREWPTEYFARVLNGGKNGASGGSRASVFGQREHNLRGLTWFYNSGFGPNLYRRWLGLKVNNDGGDQFELAPDMSKNESSVGQMRGGEGRMCLPPMLLHPIKDVELPVELEKAPEEKAPAASNPNE